MRLRSYAAHLILRELIQSGHRVSADGDRLRIRGPKLSAEGLEAVRRVKMDLLELVRDGEARYGPTVEFGDVRLVETPAGDGFVDVWAVLTRDSRPGETRWHVRRKPATTTGRDRRD